MSSLSDLWQKQLEQQVNWYHLQSLTPEEKQDLLRHLLLALHEEVNTLQKEVYLDRFHVLHRPELDKYNALLEGIDIFKLLMCVLQLLDISASEFVSAFHSKTDIVQDKWKTQQISLESDSKIFATDLDGCVVDLSPFEAHLKGMDEDDPVAKMEALETVKDLFYKKGGFLNLPMLPGAAETLHKIRSLGYTIIIITARPYWQYRRLYGDTMKWCQDHQIPYDHLLFGKDKAEVIWEKLHPARPAFFVEDRLKHVHELLDVGVPVIKFGEKGGKVDHPLVHNVTSWEEIYELVYQFSEFGNPEPSNMNNPSE